MATSNEKIAVLETEFKNMKDDLTEIKSDVKDMSTALVDKLDAMEKGAKAAHKDLGDRLAVIERWRWYLMGIGAAVGYIASHFKAIQAVIG